MRLQFADRMNSFEAGIFAILNDKKEELIKQGRKVYNLSVGTPDFQPEPHVMKAVQEAAGNPDNYKYAIADKPELIDAVIGHYKNRFHVEGLQPKEIMAVYGSQEGIAHIGLALCNPGDVVLVPNPGYPIFEMGPFLCGAQVECYPLYKEKNFVLDVNDIDEELAKKAKVMIVSYPLNPVCVTAPDHFYEELIAFAKKYEIIVIHDNAYSDIIFGGREGKSFLSFEGAKEIGVEFYSLSKSYNLTGARISFVVGNEEIVTQFRTVRSQIDYGIFLPVQYGAIAALTGPQDSVKRQCAEYERRNKALSQGLRSIGWDMPDGEGSMFAWAPIPEGYDSSVEFCLALMEKAGVICVPGSSFGSLGEGFVRFALVLDVETIEEMIRDIDASGVIKKK